MFADWVKIAVKAAVIAGVITALSVIVLSISLPAVNPFILQGYVDSVYTFAIHWCPVIERIYGAALVIIGTNIAVLLFRAGLFVFKSIMAIFE